MNDLKALPATPDQVPDCLDDLFADLPPLDPFEIKKERIATQFAALISYCGKSRTALAEELGCKKSRVSTVLSGKHNVTLKTMWDFASTLGYDFDVVFRMADERPAPQPWERNSIVDHRCMRAEVKTIPLFVKVQTPEQVICDFATGNQSMIYFSLCSEGSRMAERFSEPLQHLVLDDQSHKSTMFKVQPQSEATVVRFEERA